MESREIGPINIGNSDEYKIIDVAKKILVATDSISKIKFVPRPKDDPSKRKPDISKAKNVLKWKPSVSFDEGLTETIKYFKKIL